MKSNIRAIAQEKIEAGEHRRPAKYRIGIAFVVEVMNDDANVIDITPLKVD